MTKTIIQHTSAVVLIVALAMSAVVAWNAGTAQAQSAIIDGDLISVEGNPDVYIVKLINGKRFARLILNPTIFDSYGHLHWANIKTISARQFNTTYTISNLVREVRANGEPLNDRIYALYPDTTGDTGVRRLVVGELPDFHAESVYNINLKEASDDFYVTAAPLMLIPPAFAIPINDRVEVTRSTNGKLHNIRTYDIYGQLVTHEQYNAFGLLRDAKYYEADGTLRWIRYYRTDRTLERIAYYSTDGTRIVRNDYYNEYGTEVVRSIET